jgi:aminoglycoside phosphotransferase (APT) family kinase protein
MKLASDQRALLLRELQKSVRTILGPELTSARAQDAAQAVDRILTLLIMEDEHGEVLAETMAKRFDEALSSIGDVVSPDSQARQAIAKSRAQLAQNGAVESFGALRAAGQLAVRELGPEGLESEETRAAIRQLDAMADLRDRVARPEKSEESDEATGDAGEACSITPAQLEAYLRERMPEQQELRVVDLTPIPGGRSKETIVVQIENGGSLPGEIVLRKDRPISVVDSHAADEFELLRVVHAAGVPVPEPFLHEPDPEALGGTCLFVQRVRGEKRGEYFPEILCPDEGGEEIGRQWARALAHLHAVPLSDLTGTHLDLEPDPRAILERTIEGSYRRLIDHDGPPSIGIELAHAWLVAHLEEALGPPALCHNDVGLHNVVIDGSELTALVDWELAGIGTPASDIAKCRHTVERLMPWKHFIEAYIEGGGSPEACDPGKIDFYQVLGLMAGAVTSRFGGVLFSSGQKRDLLTANSGYDSHPRASRLLTVALARAIAGSGGA